jgi:hypothetical protein
VLGGAVGGDDGKWEGYVASARGSTGGTGGSKLELVCIELGCCAEEHEIETGQGGLLRADVKTGLALSGSGSTAFCTGVFSGEDKRTSSKGSRYTEPMSSSAEASSSEEPKFTSQCLSAALSWRADLVLDAALEAGTGEALRAAALSVRLSLEWFGGTS